MRQKPFNEKWLTDPVLQTFADLENVEFKLMFGGVAVYQERGARRVMVAYAGGTDTSGDPNRHMEWQGLLIPTEIAHHESLIRQFPSLRPHSVLRKWLYVHQSHPDFNHVLGGIYELAQQQHKWVGVVQKPRKRKA
ncbi:MAG: hypothetical protein HGB19_02380 [Chlorobiales bacterium]|jgi:hypothetical protein|nr:hypothetical protein [Chlorobiales bacterium]